MFKTQARLILNYSLLIIMSLLDKFRNSKTEWKQFGASPILGIQGPHGLYQHTNLGRNQVQGSFFGFSGRRQQLEPTTDIFKAVIPRFLYKPPFGYPRFVNLPEIRRLASTPYIEMIRNAIVDQVAATDWEIVDRDPEHPAPDADKKKAHDFLENPNINEENFDFQIRKIVTDILEIDSGVFVKVYNLKGELTQMYVRDGMTFTKNPDIFGTFTDKDELIPFHYHLGFLKEAEEPTKYIANKAAYYQYGFVTGARPVPFGTKEIIYIMRNPRADSIYGRSGVEVLADIIQMLKYGTDHNLEYFIRNNIPKGVMEVLGANDDQMQELRQQWKEVQRTPDEVGQFRKLWHIMPMVNREVNFKRVQFSNLELEFLKQQEWFLKVCWAVFGVTPSEMGMDASPSKAHEISQNRVFKRRAVRPILSILEHHINSQLIWTDFSEKIIFKWKSKDLDDDIKKSGLLTMQIRGGLITPNEGRKEIGKEEIEGGDELRQPSSGFGGANPLAAGGFQNAMKGIEQKVLPATDPNKLNNRDFSVVQTMIFDKQKFTKEKAMKYAKDNDYSSKDFTETSTAFIIRIRPTKDFIEGTFTGKQLTLGVQAITARLKSLSELKDIQQQTRKISKEDANYRIAEDKTKMCGNCKWFVRKADGNNWCKLVEGFIDYDLTSDLWTEIDDTEEEPEEVIEERIDSEEEMMTSQTGIIIEKAMASAKRINAQPPLALGPHERPATEGRIKRALRKLLNDSEKEILRQLSRTIGGTKFLNQIKSMEKVEQKQSISVIADKIKSLIRLRLAETVVKDVIKQSYFKGIEQAEKDFNANFEVDPRVVVALENHTFSNIKDLQDETANKLRAELERGLLAGEGITDIKARVKSVFDVAESRAEAIARTETTRAVNTGHLEGLKQTQVKGVVVWDASLDNRTSEICKRLDEKEVKAGENFVDSVSGFSGPAPPAHVNCRSRLRFKPDE